MDVLTAPDTDRSTVQIYALRDPRSLYIRYVGKAADPERRLQMHLSPGQLRRYRSKKNSWLKNLLADGHVPYLEIVDEVDAEKANEAERYWIAWYRSQGAPLTNGTDGGDGGAVTDPEARKRINAARLGSKHTAETKALMSASAKRRCESEAERERLRSISNGKPPVRVGETNPRAKLTDQQVLELRERSAAGATGVELAEAYGITRASVTQLVTGQTRRAAGGPVRDPKSQTVLADGAVAEIRRLHSEGVTQIVIANTYGISQAHVSSICSDMKLRVNRSGSGGI